MKTIVLKIIRLYQNNLAPTQSVLQGGAMGCRFYPSCSQYAFDAIEKRGLVAGSAKAGYRILRCNPFSSGGADFVDGPTEATHIRTITS